MHLHDPDRAARGPTGVAPNIEGTAAACHLADTDHAALLACLDAYPDDDPWVIAAARAKATLARLSPRAELPADRVAIGSRIAFSIGTRRAETAVLAPWQETATALGRIPLRTRLGISLLGMRAGMAVAVPRHDGTIERLTVHEILFRPGPRAGTSPANDNRFRPGDRP